MRDEPTMQQPTNSHDPHSTTVLQFPEDFPQVELEIRRGRARNLVRKIRQSAYLIGTARDCDMVLGDPQFAEVHACVLVGPTHVTVRHLGFDPELTIDGKPVVHAELKDNDRLRTGPYEFVVRIHRSPRHFEDAATTQDVPSGADGAEMSTTRSSRAGVSQVEQLLTDIEATRADTMFRVDGAHAKKATEGPKLFVPRSHWDVSIGRVPGSIKPAPWPHIVKRYLSPSPS